MGIFANDGPGMAEKMIANMLGFTPEEMAKTLTDFRDTIVGVAATMARIETKLDIVLASERTIENVDGSERPSGDGEQPRLADASIGGIAGNDRGSDRDAA